MHNMKSSTQHNTSDLFVQTCDVGVIFIIVETIGMDGTWCSNLNLMNKKHNRFDFAIKGAIQWSYT